MSRGSAGNGQASNQPDPQAELPLTPATFHILLALVGNERHGYSILREVEQGSGGALRLGATTLYRSIKHMLAVGMIAESEERPDPELDDERRRYYRLTEFGRRVLGAETKRLAALVTLAQTKGIDISWDHPALALGEQ